MKLLNFSFALIFVLILGGATSWSQTNSGQIMGQVLDEQKAAVPGVKMAATQIDTNITQETATSSEGVYTFPALPPGTYRVTADAKGFERVTVEKVEVFTGRVSSVEVVVKIGKAQQSVMVEDRAPLLSQDTAMIATTVEAKLIEDLPMLERSTLSVIFLTPGVTGGTGADIGSEIPSMYTGVTSPGATISASGGVAGGASMLVDGAEITGTSIPRATMLFSRDMVKEVTVVTNGVPAQYGRTGGGVINQTTRSGSNKVHGNAGWQHYDPAFMARAHGSIDRPQDHRNYMNMSAGGPVVLPKIYNGRNRTFFYASYEPSRFVSSAWQEIRLPTSDELKGKLNNSYALLDQTVLRAKGAEAALAAPRTGNLYYHSLVNSDGFPTGPTFSSTSQYVQIPGNDLSAQLAKNPVAKWLMSQYPTPEKHGPLVIFHRPDGLWTTTGMNAWGARGVRQNDNRWSTKIDHKLTDKDRIAVRYSYAPIDGVRYTFWGPDSPLNSVPTERIRSRNMTFSHSHAFTGSAIVNEFRATYARINALRDAPPAALAKDWGKEIGLVPSVTGKGMPAFNFSDSSFSGNVIGAANQGSSVEGKVIDANYGYGDDLSIVRGRHAIKTGVDIRSFQMNYINDVVGRRGGTYNFGNASTNNGVNGGSGVGTFILGLIDSYNVQTTLVPYYYRWRYYAGYFQDDFKVSPKLTLNLGLRYQVETPRSEKYNRQGTFLPDLKGTTANGLPVQGAFAFSGSAGLPRSLWPINYLGFEPRAGFAYSPIRRVTLRGSYALLHAPLTGIGNTASPNLGASAVTAGGQNGGVNPGLVSYITNPLGPLAPAQPVSGGPFFTSFSAAIYVNQTSAVPSVQQRSFAIQFQASQSLLLETGYLGSKGTHLIMSTSGGYDLNRPTNAQVIQQIKARVNFSQTVPNTLGLTDTQGRISTTTYANTLRPFQNFYGQAIPLWWDRRGNSSYNAIYFSGKQRMAKGLYLQASYTISKGFDDSVNPTFGGLTIVGSTYPQDPENLRAERSISSNDIPQKFSLGYSYELPIGRNKPLAPHNRLLGMLVGDWKLSGNATMLAGWPVSVRLVGSGYWVSQGGGVAPTASYGLRPNLVPGVPIINPNFGSGDPYFTPYLNPAAFSVPGSLDNPEFGNAPRRYSQARTPGQRLFDCALFKQFRLYRERVSLDIRSEFFNVLNHPNLTRPGTDFLTGNFNTASLTNPAVAPFTNNANFGILNRANSSSGRVIKLGAILRF